jgi:hypothetical protein
MTDTKYSEYQTNVSFSIDAEEQLKYETSINEVNLTESLLTPGLQTSIILQSQNNLDFLKNLGNFYNKTLTIKADRKILAFYDRKFEFETSQRIYRLSNRGPSNYSYENFQLDACDPTLLKDAQTYMSRSWECASPSTVVRNIFAECIKPQNVEIEESATKRPYIAENIHPFQAITQQCEVALHKSKLDPSFLHFMTYQDTGGNDIPTHNFKSLTSMAQQEPIFFFEYSPKISTDLNYARPSDVMSYSFPCDFDLLSDVLNGYDENGNQYSSLIVGNNFTGAMSLYGKMDRCGTTSSSAMTNTGSENLQGSCPNDTQQYLLKRKARMALIEQDKIALRLVVPFNPNLNVGKVINFIYTLHEKVPQNYGSGDYLIVNMTHNIKVGGLGMTILDCVSETVASGIV